MGYFANNTEAELFMEKYCSHCCNWKSDCLIMDIHFLYGYKLCNSKSIAKKILDLFIDDEGNDITKWKCQMFLPREKKEV